MLPDAMGVPLPRTRERIKRMIIVLERGTPASKDRWPGHPSIPSRVFGPSQYLVLPPVQLTKLKSIMKLKLTSKPLLANSTLKLVPPETQSDAEVVGADATPINNFVQWFQTISANMNTEAQKRALAAYRKAALSVFTDVGDDTASLMAVKTAPVKTAPV